MNKSNQDFRTAEATGKIQTMPEVVQMPEVQKEVLEVLDDPTSFQMAIGHAQMDGKDHVIVSERLFNHLLRGNKSNYLTYGTPGIKIYKAGTKEECDSTDAMNAEEYHNWKARQKK